MGKRVLLIEDEPNIIEAISFILSRAGLTVHVHSDGATAVARVLTELPSLIILDVMLPGRSGFDILRDLKDNPVSVGVPVMMLTARGHAKDRELALRLGATAFLTKPFSNAEMLACVKELVEAC